MRVKGTAKVWVVDHKMSYDQIEQMHKDGNNDDAVCGLVFNNADMDGVGGWIESGVATITVDFFPREAIVSKQIEGLREQLRQHRINAEQAEQAILSQISKLTAIAA